MSNTEENMALARKWINFLQGQYVLCPNDCCTVIRGRTLMQTTIFFNSLSEEERQAHLDVMEAVISVPEKEGLIPHIGWDGLVFSRNRSRNLRGNVTKRARKVYGGLVDAGR